MKKLAIIGFLLSFISPILGFMTFIPGLTVINIIINIAAPILIILAYWKISRHWDIPSLRQNFNRYFFTYVAMIILGIILSVQVGYLLTASGIEWSAFQDVSSWQDPEVAQSYINVFQSHIGRIASISILLFLTFLFNAWFFYQMNRIISTRIGADLFRIGGLFYFIGALTAILFGIGFLLIWISYLLLFLAFRGFPEETPNAFPNE